MLEVAQENFSGPLDLLLSLIEKEKLDITEISLAKITDAFLKEIERMDRSGDEMAEFLVIAAKLLYLKSKELLPDLENKEEEEEIADLEDRLKEYQKYKAAAEHLGHILEEGNRAFVRKAKAEQVISFVPPKNIASGSLFSLFQEVMNRVQKEETPTEKITPVKITLEEKRDHILTQIKKSKKLSFKKVLSASKSKVEVIITFLAILEMIKQKEIRVVQEKNFVDFDIFEVK